MQVKKNFLNLKKMFPKSYKTQKSYNLSESSITEAPRLPY